jgi:hypothetical protein
LWSLDLVVLWIVTCNRFWNISKSNTKSQSWSQYQNNDVLLLAVLNANLWFYSQFPCIFTVIYRKKKNTGVHKDASCRCIHWIIKVSIRKFEKISCIVLVLLEKMKNPKTMEIFPRNLKKHQMNTRNQDTFKVQFSNTERLKKSQIIYLQKILNKFENRWNQTFWCSIFHSYYSCKQWIFVFVFIKVYLVYTLYHWQ